MSLNTLKEFKLTDETVGLADYIYICPKKNKPLEGQLRTHLKIPNRQQGNAAVATLKKRLKKPYFSMTSGKCLLIDYYSTPATRRAIYLADCINHLDVIRSNTKAKRGAVAPSLELNIFIDYAPDIVADEKTYSDLNLNISDEIIEINNYMLADDDTNNDHLMLALAISNRISVDMLKWNSLDIERQRFLASVVHACATIIGCKFFNDQVKINPSLLTHFTLITETSFNRTLSDNLEEINEPTQEVIDELGELVLAIKKNPLSKKNAESLIDLSKKHLAWVVENTPSIDTDTDFLIWTTKLYLSAEKTGLPIFQGPPNTENSSWKSLCYVWFTYFKTQNENNHTQNSLVELYESILNKCIDATAELKKTELELKFSKEKLDEASEKPTSTAIEKRKLNRTTARLNLEYANKNNTFIDICEEILLTFIPKGTDPEVMDEDIDFETSEIDMSFASEELIDALHTFKEWTNTNYTLPEI